MPSGAGWSDHGLLADVGMALACAAGTSGAWSHVGLQKTGQLVDEGRNGWAMRVGRIDSLFVQACWASSWALDWAAIWTELGLQKWA